MGEALSDARLAEIRGRCDKATDAPWWNEAYRIIGRVVDGRPNGEVIGEMGAVVARLQGKVMTACNTEFVCHARTDVPDLLDEVQRLKKCIKAVHDENQNLRRRLAHYERNTDGIPTDE